MLYTTTAATLTSGCVTVNFVDPVDLKGIQPDTGTFLPLNFTITVYEVNVVTVK